MITDGPLYTEEMKQKLIYYVHCLDDVVDNVKLANTMAETFDKLAKNEPVDLEARALCLRYMRRIIAGEEFFKL